MQEASQVSQPKEYHLGRTFRSNTGNRRVTYRPDWSKESPWVSYYYGTAGLQFTTLVEAQKYHARFGDPLVTNSNE